MRIFGTYKAHHRWCQENILTYLQSYTTSLWIRHPLSQWHYIKLYVEKVANHLSDNNVSSSLLTFWFQVFPSPPTLVFFRIVSPGRHSERIYSSCNIRSIGYLRSTYGTIDTCTFFIQAVPKKLWMLDCLCSIECEIGEILASKLNLPSRGGSDLCAFLWSEQV